MSKIIKNSKNIFIIIFVWFYNFIKIFIKWFFSLFFFKKNIIIKEKFVFLGEILEKRPKKFFNFPTAIALGRMIFMPILFIFSQKKNDKNP